MAFQKIISIYSDSLYLLPKKESIVVTGNEIINSVIHDRLPADVIVKINKDLAYRLNDNIVSGADLLNYIPSSSEHVPDILIWGTFLIAFIIGWNLYFINRYRKRENIAMADLTTVITALSGAAILTLLKHSFFLIGIYSVGVFVGFFTYFGILLYAASKSADPAFKFPDLFLKHIDQQIFKKCSENHKPKED